MDAVHRVVSDPSRLSPSWLEKLVAENPEASNAWLNYGFAYVDKIPVEGAITQVILANTSLGDTTSMPSPGDFFTT